MAQVSFKIGNLSSLNTTSLPIADGQFIVAKNAAENRAEIYVDAGSSRLRVGDFETYASLADLNAAYAEGGSGAPSTSKLYYIQNANILAVWAPKGGSSHTGAFVQVNDCGVTDVQVSGTGDFVASASLSDDGRTLTLTMGSFAAANIPLTDAGGYFTTDDVESALQELAAASAGGVASKTIWVTDDSAGQSDYAKVYKIWQGENSPEHATAPATLKGTINIPKDKVLQDAEVVDITFSDGHLYDGVTDVTTLIVGSGTATAADAGKYIKMVMQNVTDPLYVSVKDLVDEYTAAQGATQVQLAISNTNEISASLVAGGVGTTELANSAVTTAKIDDAAVSTAKIADDAVTADKVSIAVHSESQTAGADGLAISVSTTDGQVSAVSASIAANTYDAYGAASGVQTTVIGTSGDAATDNTIYGAKAYADQAATAALTWGTF